MGRLNKTQDGFSVVEGLLVVIILCLVGFVGWYVIHANKTSSSTNAPANNTSTTAKATPQADPYKGWAVASSSKLSVSFKYPSDWKSSIPDGTATCSGVILANVEPSAGDLSSAATIVNPLLKSYRINITQFGAQSSKCAADGSVYKGTNFSYLTSSEKLTAGLLKGKSLTFLASSNSTGPQSEPDGAVVTENNYDGTTKNFTETAQLILKVNTYQIDISTDSGAYKQTAQPVSFSLDKFKTTDLYKKTLLLLNSIN